MMDVARGSQRGSGYGAATPWLGVAATGVVAASWWLRAPGWAALALVALAAAVAAVSAPRLGARWRAVAFVAVAAAFVGAGVRALRMQVDAMARGGRIEARAAEAGTAALVAAISAAAREAQAAADRAVALGARGGALFDALAPLVAAPGDRAVVLARGGIPIAWAGRLTVPLDSLPARRGVLATPFYLVLYATAAKDDRSAVATVLLHARDGASALAAPLDVPVAVRTGVRAFSYADPATARRERMTVVTVDGEPLVGVRALQEETAVMVARALDSARFVGALLLGLLALAFVVAAWRPGASPESRAVAMVVPLVALAVAPLGDFAADARLFDGGVYFASLGGPFTANLGELALTCATLLFAMLAILRRRRRPGPRWRAALALALVVGVGPFVLRDLARGIRVPLTGVDTRLWLAWELTLFLAALVVLLAGASAGQALLRPGRGLPRWVAPVIAAGAALAGPVAVTAAGRMPSWYPVPWALAITALALTRRARTALVPSALVAAFGAVALVWGGTVRARVEQAEADVRGLAQADPAVAPILQRFGQELAAGPVPVSRVGLLARFAASPLDGAGLPVELATWDARLRPVADLRVGIAPGATYGLDIFAREAASIGRPLVREAPSATGAQWVLAVPHADGVTTVVVSPRTHLVPDDPFGALLGTPPPPVVEPTYTLRLGEVVGTGIPSGPRWERRDTDLHADWLLPAPNGRLQRVHGSVELRPVGALAARGLLLVAADLVLTVVLWALLVLSDGALGRWLRIRRRASVRSLQTRIAVALFAFFTVPAAVFAFWSYQRLQVDDRNARDLLVRETLRGVAAVADASRLQDAADRFETPLFLYAGGILVAASDPVHDVLAPFGRLLPPEVARAADVEDAPTAATTVRIGATHMRFGYRSATDSAGTRLTLAAPARADELSVDRRRRDLGMLVLLAAALGALAAFTLSGTVARTLTSPIAELRRAALALAGGERVPPLEGRPPREFLPLYRAFRQMGVELALGEEALRAAERRLALVLRDVASGVMAVDSRGEVLLSNPRADVLLGDVQPGTPIEGAGVPALADRVRAFLRGGPEAEEFDILAEGRQLHVRLTRLGEGERGAVITVDDVTEVARAQRVLAWGEMARQVAHEIKNPLTPMRLGIQHLRRAWRDQRPGFGSVLEQNADQVLAQIDRLDEIARTFSRYGTGPGGRGVPGAADVAAAVRDVVALERLGDGGVEWRIEGDDTERRATAHDGELRDVLLNLLENARLAEARAVTVRLGAAAGGGVALTVEDDGHGIPADVLPRIFEPHFSTRTSGSGLGLAICRRLIEGWGGSIAVASTLGRGTAVEVVLAPVPAT